MDISNPGDYIASVACRYDDIGYAAIKFIAEKQPGAKIFYCAGQQGAGVYEKYQEGIDRAMKKYGDKVTIVSTLHGDWRTDKAYNVTTDLIASGTKFNYIFANNGLMAQGCYQALKDAGLTSIPIVSTGGSPDDYKMLQAGVESANMTAPVCIQGVKTFMNLYRKVVEGKDPEQKFTPLPVIPVTRDKLDKFIAWNNYTAAYKYLQENK
jgi:ABC-type sugar transport system substrate-binding protein